MIIRCPRCQKKITTTTPKVEDIASRLLQRQAGRINPSNPKLSAPVTLRLVRTLLVLRPPQWDPELARFIKTRMRMRWNQNTRFWSRELGVFDQQWNDRLIEAAILLLAKGYSVDVPHAIRDAVLNHRFTPETLRWVGKEKDEFVIWWNRWMGEDHYSNAMGLPLARWESPFVRVPAEFYRVMERFANENDFALTPGAKALIEAARLADGQIPTFDPKLPDRTDDDALDGGEPMTIDPSLRD